MPVRIAWASLGCLVLSGAFAIARLAPPAVVGADAPPERFSAERALEHLKVIAREKHPAGSPAHARVREYLLAQMNALGLEPEVHAGHDEWAPSHTGGTLFNLVGRLRGTASTRAVMLATHYDSAPESFGAGDAGASVAAVMETVRAVKAGPPLRNDLLVLVTDAEELGLLGAMAFARDRSEAKEVGAVVNLEARGTSGPSILFETTPGNGRLIEVFAAVSPRPVTNSLAAEVYRRMPNGTDLMVFREVGIPGVGFAFIHDVKNYHMPGDNLENLDPRSLQHQGENALALARAYGGMDLGDVRAPDAVFFDVLAAAVVRYPASWALPLAGMAAAAWVGVVAWGLRVGEVRISGVAVGLGFALLALTLAALAGWLVWWTVRKVQGPVPYPDLIATISHPAGLAGTLALALAAAWAPLGFAARRWGDANALLGGLVLWLGLALAAAVLAPGASYLFLWPPVAALAGLVATWPLPRAAAGAPRPAPPLRASLAATAGALPGFLMLAPVACLFYDAMMLPLAPVQGVLVGLALLLVQKKADLRFGSREQGGGQHPQTP